MHDPANELPRILPRTSVNKGKKKGWGIAAPAPIAVLSALSSLRVALRRAARHVHRYARLASYYPSVLPWKYHRLLSGTDLCVCLYIHVWVRGGGLDDVTHALTPLKEGLGQMPDPGAVLRHDRLGRVLCQVNSTRLIALISATAMETDA